MSTMKFFWILSIFAIASNADPALMHHGDFAPLACNSIIDSASCETFSSQNYDLSQIVEIPCGSCIIMDLIGSQTFQQGLDVQGKLVFPADRSSLQITTPFVFVQGEFIVEELWESTIPQPGKYLEFLFVGKDDITFVSHPDQVFDKCSSGCNVSKKAFVVAGGRLDIQGMNQNCNTWTRIKATRDAGASEIEPISAPEERSGCSKVLVSETFDSDTSLLLPWDGIGAGSASTQDGHFSVSSRTSGTQGPRVFLPVDCITPNQPYVMKFRYRYRHFSSTKSEFNMPYLKIVRYKVNGGNDWMSVDEVYGRGETTKIPVDEWQQLEAVIRFDDSMADPTFTSDLTLYISPFDDAEIIDIDDFVLELAPAGVFENRSCDSLLVNGDADANSPFAYPFYTTGGAISVITDGDSPNGSAYFRNTFRSSKWSSPISQDVSPECLTKSAIYEFSANVRIDSTESKQLSVSFTIDGAEYGIATCPPSAGEWVYCTGRIRLDSEHEGGTSASFSTRVVGSDSETISGVDMANVKLEYLGGRTIKIMPENLAGISDCWAPGAEVLVTSHTIQHTDSQVAIIASIEENGDILLEDVIHKPISIEDDAQTAVEVALLTRNIRFIAADDDQTNPLHGGHVIIMHTPAPTIQRIVGIESHGFGQQGKLGRYPFHFHMCGSVAGSVVSKNAVRNTKQRGIVVHGTNDLYLEGNILHNTKGHGFMLEDGAEQGNTFIQNLGAVGHPVEIRISDDESDHAPSTYWITNPQNKWIGNVAAGSEHSGFWFEVKTKVRGPSAHAHQDMVPNKLALLKFIDNVSHSSAQGLQTYPQAGYRPENLAIFENHRSYRNRVSGIFFHAGGRLSIDGGYISDNPIGVDIDMDHSDVISNTKIIGLSQAYRAVISDWGQKATMWPARSLCSKPLVGVRLDSYHDGSLFGATGTKVLNTVFSGFGTESCEGSSAIHVDKEDTQYFDTRNSLESVTVTDDSSKVNLCDGEEQVAIRVVDGAFLHGSPGFLISDTDAIKSHPDCFGLLGTCAAFCPNVCLRTMTVMIPSTSTYERGDLTLHVSGNIPDGRSITPIEVQDFQDKEQAFPDSESTHGRFFVTLPAGGSYSAHFIDNMSGDKIWPLYADLKYEDAIDNCGIDFDSFDIETLVPDQCEQLIQNGDFESGTSDHWRYTGHYGIEVVSDGVDGSIYSLKAPNSEGGPWVGPGQYLDTRCIEEDYVYTITAKIKLTDSTTGILVGCNLEAYPNNDDSCPTAALRFTNRLGETQNDWVTIGRLETTNREWNTLSGSYVASDFAGSANAIYLYITGVKKGIDIQLDDVQLIRSETTSEPTAVPSSAPTRVTSHPTSAPTTAPTAMLNSSEGPSPTFQGSNSNSITFDADGAIRLESSSQEPSTVMSTLAHEGVAGTDGDIELTVQITDRDFSDSGWQPSVVLFFAHGATPIEDVTTPDNGFHNFEGSVVAYMNHRMYPTLGSYFRSYTKQEEGTFLSGSSYANTTPLPTTGTALKLSRTAGMIRAFYSLDAGTSWNQIGSEHRLAHEFQNVPLKVGYRVYMEYKTSYRIETIPSIVSGGEAMVAPSQADASFFDGTNADLDSVSCNASDGCLVQGQTNIAKLLSHQTFEDDVVFISEFTNRPMFGSGYQSGLWLFMVPADATLGSIPNRDDEFRDYALGTVGDKIYAPTDYTYVYSSSISASGSSTDQYLGQSWKNINGYYKLQRINGRIGAYISPNGNTWTQVGNEIELPAGLANAPVKLGYRVQKNWAPGYEFQVRSTVEHITNIKLAVEKMHVVPLH